jgi:hypothetical protein
MQSGASRDARGRATVGIFYRNSARGFAWTGRQIGVRLGEGFEDKGGRASRKRWPIELILLRAANPVLQPLDELARERVTTLFASPDAPCPPGASPDGTRPYLAN